MALTGRFMERAFFQEAWQIDDLSILVAVIDAKQLTGYYVHREDRGVAG